MISIKLNRMTLFLAQSPDICSYDLTGNVQFWLKILDKYPIYKVILHCARRVGIFFHLPDEGVYGAGRMALFK